MLAEPVADAAVEAVGETGLLPLQAFRQRQQVRLWNAPRDRLDCTPAHLYLQVMLQRYAHMML